MQVAHAQWKSLTFELYAVTEQVGPLQMKLKRFLLRYYPPGTLSLRDIGIPDRYYPSSSRRNHSRVRAERWDCEIQVSRPS